MKGSSKFQLHPLMASEMMFEYFFRKFSLSFAMATNHVQRFGQHSYVHMFGRGLLKEHFCKAFVKISAVGLLSLYPL